MRRTSLPSAPVASCDGRPYTLAGENINAGIVDWVARQIGFAGADLMPATGIAVMFGDEIIAGVVYNEYRELDQGRTMQASIAAISPRWATRRVLYDLFAYPFLQMRVTRLWTAGSRKNRHARKIAERLGFRYEGMARRAWDGQTDAVIQSMFPEECRWIVRDGKESAKAA